MAPVRERGRREAGERGKEGGKEDVGGKQEGQKERGRKKGGGREGKRREEGREAEGKGRCLLHCLRMHTAVPVCGGWSSSQEEHAAILPAPGEGGEAAVEVELSSTDQVHLWDTARNYHLSRVGGTEVRV